MKQTQRDCGVRLRDGRRIGVAEFGTLRGTPVFYFHGFPASRLEGQLVHDAAVRQHVRLVALDRPGFGCSDFRPRTLADWPRDVVEVADALGVNRFAIYGLSGGAPFALACAADLPDRVSATAIVAGLGMTMVTEDFAQLEVFARSSFRLARTAPLLYQASLRSDHVEAFVVYATTVIAASLVVYAFFLENKGRNWLDHPDQMQGR